jgi:PAS domain S-box-containing protein
MADITPDKKHQTPMSLLSRPGFEGATVARCSEHPSAPGACFRALVENAFEALWLFTAEGQVSYASPANEYFFGRKPAAVVGRLGLELVHPEDADSLRALLGEVLRRPGEIVNGEFRVPHEDGSWRWVDARARNLLDQPDVAAIVVSARDVTERRRAEDEIHRLNAELENRVAARTAEIAAINRELEAFTYSVSHDLRAPLRTIEGFSKILAEECSSQLDDLGRGYLDRVRKGAERMNELIDGLLELSGVTRAQMSPRAVDLTAMVSAIADDLRAREPQRDVAFVIDEGVIAEGDPRLLRVALENLLGNAWKYTANKPVARIEFGTTWVDGRRVYFVRDDGAGFDMQLADRLFVAFQRLHDKAFAGTGIGLSTVERIIRRHGGRIWAKGAVGQGAVFHFTLG